MAGPAAIFLLIVVGIIVTWAITSKMAADQRAELGALAGRYGLNFDPETHSLRSATPLYASFHPFTQGQSRKTFNTLTGQLQIDANSVEMIAGDYEYKAPQAAARTAGRPPTD